MGLVIFKIPIHELIKKNLKKTFLIVKIYLFSKLWREC
jgi:hypothetical protein